MQYYGSNDNFIWKPRYKNEIEQLESDLNKLEKVTMFKEEKVKAEHSFDDGRFFTFRIQATVFYDERNFEKQINTASHKYRCLESGQYHQIVINEIDEFIKQYEKIFKPKKIKQNNITLESEPGIEGINTGKDDISTDK